MLERVGGVLLCEPMETERKLTKEQREVVARAIHEAASAIDWDVLALKHKGAARRQAEAAYSAFLAVNERSPPPPRGR